MKTSASILSAFLQKKDYLTLIAGIISEEAAFLQFLRYLFSIIKIGVGTYFI